MDMTGFPVREVLLGALAVAGLYLTAMLLRLAFVRKRKAAEPVFAPQAPKVDAETDAVQAEDEDADADDEPVLTYSRPVAVPPPDNVHSFGAELSRSQLEREVKQLREEIAGLRTELEEVKAAHRVSPQYADAAALVQRGLTAQDVADRCSISLGEAELVSALARGPRQFEEEDGNGIDSGFNRTRTA